VAGNVLEHGTGAINVDATRIGTGEDKGIWPITNREDSRTTYSAALTHTLTDAVETDTTKGRWPANLILQHLPECAGNCAPGCPVAALDLQSGDCAVSGAAKAGRPARGGAGTGVVQFGVEDGNGTLHNDSGGASRFFKQVGGGEADADTD
jgi:site-specific DNA-methyltransferase (adenine-specific)